MGALDLTPDKAARAPFPDPGKVGLACRENCFNNGLVMRSVVDCMVISPPLVITRSEIDEFIDKAVMALDQTYDQVKAEGLV